MRGRTDEMTICQRVAFYRRRRGLSQEVLAGLVGRAVEWLRKVENNRGDLDRLSVLRVLCTSRARAYGLKVLIPRLIS